MTIKRNQLDTIGRCNTNKRGPKGAEPELTKEQLEFARWKASIKHANRLYS